jgi:hypothetical protein
VVVRHPARAAVDALPERVAGEVDQIAVHRGVALEAEVAGVAAS